LGLRAPAAARSGKGRLAREGRFGTVEDGRGLSTGTKEGGEEGEGGGRWQWARSDCSRR
jgi:hypothetical protein